MILGLSLQNFTLLHVIISLIGIVTGFVVVFGMLKGERMGVWTALFLVTTILTTATGFLFPNAAFTPALAVGYVSSAVLIVTLLALYVFRLAGPWRWIYVIGALVALYLNTFVGVVQSFQKILVRARAGANAIRATLHYCAEHRLGHLCRARLFRHQEISSYADPAESRSRAMRLPASASR